MTSAWPRRRLLPTLRVALERRRQQPPTVDVPASAGDVRLGVQPTPVEIAPDDPLLSWLQAHPEPALVSSLRMDSPAVRALREAGVALVVPLVAQGELIGLLNLGPRLSEQEYSGDDRKLLENLAGQAAPALRVAQLVREQETEVRRRERYEQELRVAQLIQQNFLPRQLPELPGWRIGAYYQPAREVGGDFYDFIPLPDDRIGVVVGDVTDKGVPAALVMASARSVLRSSAQRMDQPGQVLEWVNDRLCVDMPPRMFVTCLYGVLDPATGRFRFANAGHNLPCVQTDDGAVHARATGMPLGLMAGSRYDESEVVVAPGRGLLLYSDALPEAHDSGGDMYGFSRVLDTFAALPPGPGAIDAVMADLREFTGPQWEQEDDITLVTLEREAPVSVVGEPSATSLLSFTVPSQAGTEREVAARVVAAALDAGLPEHRREQLATAVGEATMNAIEHGNAGRPELPVEIDVAVEGRHLVVRVTDQGGGGRVPTDLPVPDIDAKLRGEQSPRGWGLFLIRSMVDDLDVVEDGSRHTLALGMRLDGADDE